MLAVRRQPVEMLGAVVDGVKSPQPTDGGCQRWPQIHARAPNPTPSTPRPDPPRGGARRAKAAGQSAVEPQTQPRQQPEDQPVPNQILAEEKPQVRQPG